MAGREASGLKTDQRLSSLQEHSVHGSGGGLPHFRSGPLCRAKRRCRFAPAQEAGTVPRSQCLRLVQEEEFGPAPAGHDVTTPILVVAATDQPRLARPALSQQGLGRRVVDDAGGCP